VFSSVDSQIALAFLRRYPTPVDARGLGEQRLAAFLKRHGYPGRKPAGELLERLRAGAEGRAGELETAARRQLVLALVSALEPIVQRISELTIEIRHALDEHPDGATFRSLFIAHDSWLCAASMLAEIGDCRDRYPSYRELAADAGQCPVAVQSGKAKRAQFRWACDHRLRQAFDVLADSSRRHNPWAADIYQRACNRGAGHAHAARVLGRAWCQVIWRLWQNQDTYNPAQHTALQRLIAAAA
jgi:transposase